MLNRWQWGELHRQVALLFDRHRHSVRKIVDRARGHSPFDEEKVLEGAEPSRARGDFPGLAAGRSIRTIAALLMNPPSTISREIGRNEQAEGGASTAYLVSGAIAPTVDTLSEPTPPTD